MARNRNCWWLFWEGDECWQCWPTQWYEEVQIKGLFLLFPFNCFGISLVNDQTPVYTQHNTVLLHHHQRIVSISFQGSTNAIYWLLDGVTVHIYTGLYVASVEFCNSLNVMLSNLISRMSKSSWPTVNHPTYDLNALLNSTTLAHGISISLRVRVDKRNFDTWLVSTSTCLHSYLCVAYLWGFVTVFR